MKKNFRKKLVPLLIALVTIFCGVSYSASNAYAWRSTSSKSISGRTLYARADLPKSTDSSGGGNWKAQASYSGSRTGNKITVAWSFYSIGGSVSYQGMGVSGSGSNPGSSFTATSTVANASGKVYGHGLWIYVGMYSTASFSYGNSYYSTTAKI